MKKQARKLGVQPALSTAPIPPVLREVFSVIAKAKISCEDLEARSGIHHTSFLAWRSGDQTPRIHNVEALLNTVGYRLEVRKIKKGK